MFKQGAFDSLENAGEACVLGKQFYWHPVPPDSAPPLQHAPRLDLPVGCPGYGPGILKQTSSRSLVSNPEQNKPSRQCDKLKVNRSSTTRKPVGNR